MADSPRLEDLRKRYHENPRRFFAPLANEYRKSGYLDRALLLCQKHVPEQPENMNGLVVYGQTLFEMGQTDAAREPFEQALKLDPENLIALRHLGDIARLGGDVPTAKGWYDRVLELDRRNDEVLDLLAQMGVGQDSEPKSGPSIRPSAAISDLISVAPTVSVAGATDIGMIDLEPARPAAEPPRSATPAPAAGKGSTVVINVQAMAERDRQEQSASSTVTQPTAAVTAPIAEAPSARPSRRASLLDIDFDFSETAEPEASKPAPAAPLAPLLGAEAAEYGFAESGVVELPPVDGAAGTLIIEPSAQGDALGETLSDTLAGTIGDAHAATHADAAPSPAAGDFELAEFSAEVSPLAGLEANEFESESVAPLADLEGGSISASVSSVAPLDGLDRPDLTLDELPPTADGLMPLVDGATEAEHLDSLGLPLIESSAEAEIVETPSARPKPRMTKADLASLPLLADFGLDDDAPAEAAATSAALPEVALPDPALPEPALPEPASVASAESARPSKATPTFVTETMAALYVKQGLLPEAIGVYRQLVEASPDDAGLRAKLGELERMHAQESLAAPAAAAPAATQDPHLEMPEFEPSPEIAEPLPAAANSALANVSFGEIGLQGQGAALPEISAPAVSGPTAREFFSTFARRAAVAAAAAASLSVPSAAAAQADLDPSSAPTPLSTPSVREAASAASASSAPQWPLDALFGAATDVRDLHAAETLASVGSYAGNDGGTGLDTLLAGDAPPQRRSVPRASEMLKFDQFFQKPGTGASPELPITDAAPGDDDLDQFQDWLKGLKK